MFNMTQTSGANINHHLPPLPQRERGAEKHMTPLLSAPGGSPTLYRGSEVLQFITCPVFEKDFPRTSSLGCGRRSSCFTSKLCFVSSPGPPLPHSAHPGFTGVGVGKELSTGGGAGKPYILYSYSRLLRAPVC